MNPPATVKPLAETWTEVYDSQSLGMSLPRRFMEVPGSLWRSRQLAWRLFQRNLTANYRQSFLGWLWVLLPPTAAAGVWVFLNASGTLRLSHLGITGYAAFVFTGMMLWQAFIDGLTGPMNTLLANRTTLSKLQFPREVFVSLSLLETGFDFLARLVIAGMFLWMAGLIHWTGFALLAFLWGPLLIVLGTGMGLLLAPFGLLYKDVGRTIALVSPLWMLLTPVIYPLPGGPAGSVMAWVNPPAAAIQVARSGAVTPLVAANQSDAAPSVTESNGTVQPTAATSAAVEVPVLVQPTTVWLPAVLWLGGGAILFLVGAVWLDLSGPIIIERLAN